MHDFHWIKTLRNSKNSVHTKTVSHVISIFWRIKNCKEYLNNLSIHLFLHNWTHNKDDYHRSGIVLHESFYITKPFKKVLKHPSQCCIPSFYKISRSADSLHATIKYKARQLQLLIRSSSEKKVVRKGKITPFPSYIMLVCFRLWSFLKTSKSSFC